MLFFRRFLPSYGQFNVGLILFFGTFMLFGGSSNGGHGIHALFNIIALIALIVPFFGGFDKRIFVRGGIAILVFSILFLLMIIIQLVPLSFERWLELPDRDLVNQIQKIIGHDMRWRQLSLNPQSTALSAILIIMPVLVSVTLLPQKGKAMRSSVLFFIPAIASISALLGLVQILLGPSFYFYDFVNEGLPIGVFSNANHQATLMLMSIPFLAVAGWHYQDIRNQFNAYRIQKLGVILLFITVLIGLFGARSLAGYYIFVPVVVGSLFILVSGWNGSILKKRTRILFLIFMIIMFALAFLVNPDDLNVKFFRDSIFSRASVVKTMEVILHEHYLWGTGLGSFEDVYRIYEDGDEVANFIYNHAHNDYLEWFMETGLMGVLLFITFLGWLASKIVKIWRCHATLDVIMGRAASISLGAVMIHSIVDYPIRTYTILIACAFCIGLILSAQPPAKARSTSLKV